MSAFDRDDPVKRFKQTECDGCGRRKKLEGRTDLDYWLSYAYEEGHVDDADYAWLRHDDDWFCRSCSADEFQYNDTGLQTES